MMSSLTCLKRKIVINILNKRKKVAREFATFFRFAAKMNTGI